MKILLIALGLASVWTPEQVTKVVTVSNVIVSPDGRYVVWVEGRPNPDEEKTDNLNQIVLARADGSDRFVMTRGETSASNPEFSSDSRSVYFQRSGGVWRISIDGGEAERVLKFEGALRAYHLSPDDQQIAFLGAPADHDAEQARKEMRDFRVIDTVSHHIPLWVAPVRGGVAHRLYDAPYEIRSFQWSPDSRAIVFDHQPEPGVDWALTADIGEVQVENGAVHELAATAAAESNPQYSPDGKYIAFSKSPPKPTWIGESHVAVLELASGKLFELPETEEAGPNVIGWSADSARVLYTESRGTQIAIYSRPVREGAAVKLELLGSEGVIRGASLRNSRLGFAMESLTKPPEAYWKPVDSGGSPIQVSSANPGLGRMTNSRLIRWKSKDGLDVEGILHLPLDGERKGPLPLVVSVHGGPQGMYAQDYPGRGYPISAACLTSRGYAVFMPNFRGSIGYGKKFRYADRGDWGGGDWRDIEAGVDHLIAQGIVDPKRLALMGWSYGGYMAMWGPTQTNRYVVSIAGAGMSNLISQIGASDMTYDIPETYSAEYWENPKPFLEQSPLTYINRVKTPVLLLHGENDARDPTGESWQYYNALKRIGVKTELAIFPRQPHGVQERKLRLQLMDKILEWLDRYLGSS